MSNKAGRSEVERLTFGEGLKFVTVGAALGAILSRHDVAPASEDFPAGHASHEVDAYTDIVPGGHSEQELASELGYLPAGQNEQELEPALDCIPSEQRSQETALS